MPTRRTLLVSLLVTPLALVRTSSPARGVSRPEFVAAPAPGPSVWFVDHEGWIVPGVDRDAIVMRRRGRRLPLAHVVPVRP